MNIEKLELAEKTKYLGSVVLGEIFGHWVVCDERPYITKNKRTSAIYFFCSCVGCDKTQFVNIHQLKKYRVDGSGGCVSCSRKRNVPAGNMSVLWKGYEEIPMSYIHNIRNSAVRRNITWQVSIEHIWKLFVQQDRKCKISGVQLQFPSTINKRDGTASLDRIDRSRGYIEGNLQWVHKDVNEMKWDMSDKELIDWCKIIANYNSHV